MGQSIIYLVALFDHDRHMKVIFPKSSFLIHEINVTMLFESSPLQYFLYRMKVQPAVSTIVIVNLSKSASRTKRSREKMHFQHKVLCCVLPFYPSTRSNFGPRTMVLQLFQKHVSHFWNLFLLQYMAGPVWSITTMANGACNERARFVILGCCCHQITSSSSTLFLFGDVIFAWPVSSNSSTSTLPPVKKVPEQNKRPGASCLERTLYIGRSSHPFCRLYRQAYIFIKEASEASSLEMASLASHKQKPKSWEEKKFQ